MDQQQLATELTNIRDQLNTIISDAEAAPPPPPPPPVVVPPPPPPSPPPVASPPSRGLAAIQGWLGDKTVGIYIGIESQEWTPSQFDQAAANIKSWGGDYGIVKIGEGAGQWYNGDIATLQQIFFRHGLGFAPYHYCLPGDSAANANIAAHAAKQCGGVILDIEDEFKGFDQDLATIFSGLRAQCPNEVIIMSGYGDPHYALGDAYPHHTIATAPIDGYQPQWYIGVWDLYKSKGYLGAFSWGDRDIASVYGENVVLQPAISIQGIDPNDFEGMAAFLKNWHASLAIWEYQQCNAAIVGACKKGISS